MMDALLILVLLVTGLYSAAVLGMLAWALGRRSRRRRDAAGAARARAEIAAAVVNFVAGSDDLQTLRGHMSRHREVVEESLLLHHASMSGDSRNRLSQLALDLGLVQGWCEAARSRSAARRRAALSRLAMVAAHEPSRRLSGEILHAALSDPDGESRLEAARTLVHSDRMKEVELVFRLALAESPMGRAVLAEELRPFSLSLCEGPVQTALGTQDARALAAALEILAAWERALPLKELAALAGHHDRRIRLLALQALPLAPLTPEGRDAILRSLREGDDETRIAAAKVVGRLKLEAALAPLARCLRTGTVEVARAAAAALGSLHPRGWETLAEMGATTGTVAASAALEALERARKMHPEAS
jgi:hypothetical protein